MNDNPYVKTGFPKKKTWAEKEEEKVRMSRLFGFHRREVLSWEFNNWDSLSLSLLSKNGFYLRILIESR